MCLKNRSVARSVSLILLNSFASDLCFSFSFSFLILNFRFFFLFVRMINEALEKRRANTKQRDFGWEWKGKKNDYWFRRENQRFFFFFFSFLSAVLDGLSAPCFSLYIFLISTLPSFLKTNLWINISLFPLKTTLWCSRPCQRGIHGSYASHVASRDWRARQSWDCLSP